MVSKTDLLLNFDAAVRKNHFQIWNVNESYYYTGKMRALGFTSKDGVGIVLETFGYDVRQGILHESIFLLGTLQRSKWMHYGNGVYVPSEELTEFVEAKRPSTLFKATSRERVFEVFIDQAKLKKEGYWGETYETPAIQMLLFKLCDDIPNEWLFSEVSYIQETFEMPSDTKWEFCIYEWEHPSIAVYLEDIPVSTFVDIQAMAEAVCTGKPLQLIGTPNTYWRMHFDVTPD